MSAAWGDKQATVIWDIDSHSRACCGGWCNARGQGHGLLNILFPTCSIETGQKWKLEKKKKENWKPTAMPKDQELLAIM